MELDWKINIVNLVTIAVSVTAIVISLKNRRNGMRDNLFNRQINSYQAIFHKVLELEWLFGKLVGEENLGETEIEDIVKKLEEISEDIAKEYYKAQLIMPDKVSDKLAKHLKNLEKFVKGIDSSNRKKIDLDELDERILKVENYMRKAMKSYELNSETDSILRRKMPL